MSTLVCREVTTNSTTNLATTEPRLYRALNVHKWRGIFAAMNENFILAGIASILMTAGHMNPALLSGDRASTCRLYCQGGWPAGTHLRSVAYLPAKVPLPRISHNLTQTCHNLTRTLPHQSQPNPNLSQPNPNFTPDLSQFNPNLPRFHSTGPVSLV